MWEGRNGWIDVRPIWNRGGATLYTTKAAAMTVEITWSDTIARYARQLSDRPIVALHP